MFTVNAPNSVDAGGRVGNRRHCRAGLGANRAESGALEEIVVTARKRNENFQDVPITVNVFTAQEIAGGGNRKRRAISSPWCRT